MPSLFADTDELICSTLGIQRRKQLGSQSLSVAPLSDEAAASLVNGLYERMADNVPARIVAKSGMLWKCRRATRIADRNQSPETLLEKVVAGLAKHDHMPGWFNQCSVASGIVSSYSDRRRAVDLVHLSGDTARLIELKWCSDTPVHALFQVLEYGLAYVIARLRMADLGLVDQPLMQVGHVRLEVVGPRKFFRTDRQSELLFVGLGRALSGFARERSSGAWSMSVEARAFPEEFDRVPFPDGKAVNAESGTGTLTSRGRAVRDAFYRLEPV